MGCCGKKNRTEATVEIIKSHGNAIIDRTMSFTPRYSGYQERINTCQLCSHRTWLSRKERLNWIICNLGIIIVRPNKIADKTTKLPIRLEPLKNDILCCQECRCVCDVKARDRNLRCCLNKWRK